MTTPPVHHRFIEPLDVLFLRGNKLFGEPGSHGESLVPPWPSLAAGALRSAMLARAGVDLIAFAAGRHDHPELGTPLKPGPFTVASFSLARRATDGRIEALHALPADLVPQTADDGCVTGVRRLSPVAPAVGLLSSAPLAHWPVLARADRGKTEESCWLTQTGWAAYLAGHTPSADQILRTGALWAIDARVGVGLDAEKRRAADGQLFTVQAVALHRDIGFLVSVVGAEPPASGVLRFGGDGRGAALRAAVHQGPTPDLHALTQTRRARVVLTSPGLFPQGWCLPGVDTDQLVSWPGMKARLVCAAVPRAEVVSGWDLAQRRPKAAERAAPAGSVYWLDEVEASSDALGKLAETGLWFGAAKNGQRRAEGFNRFTFAAW